MVIYWATKDCGRYVHKKKKKIRHTQFYNSKAKKGNEEVLVENEGGTSSKEKLNEDEYVKWVLKEWV